MPLAANGYGTKRLLRVLLALSSMSILAFSCSNPPGLEKDLERPTITITYPMNGAVLGDSILIKTQAYDNESVVEAEFIIDGATEYTDLSSPFLYMWRLEGYEIGSIHTVQTAAYDQAGNRAFSEVVCVSYQWKKLIDDTDDPWVGDVLRAYARDDSVIDFLVEIDCSLGTCYDYDMESVSTAIVLNTDLDSATGCTRHPVGADYMAWASFDRWGGVFGPWLYEWYPSNDNFILIRELESPGYTSDWSVFRVQLNLSEIGWPDTVGIIFWGDLETSNDFFYDWAPDKSEDPIVYPLDGLYLGERATDDGGERPQYLTRTRGPRSFP